MKHPGRITVAKRLVFLSACVFGLMALAAARDGLPDKITGRVTSGATPVANAIVRLQATDRYVMTDADGKFTLPDIPVSGETYITAAKAGYYNNRVKVSGAPLEIQLRPLPGEDNTAYQWQDPTPNPQHKDNCGNCHTAIYKEWSQDAHGQSSLNPLLLTMYNGTDVHGKPDVRPGYRLDWNDFGNCATCHAPVAALNHKLSADLEALGGVEKSGISCDFCHKIKNVQFDRSFPNFADIKVWRPPQGEKLMFGPFDDATFPREEPDFSYSPLFKSSQLCAGCHDGMFWGVPAYETYSEWRQSPYNEKGIQCQDCHMKPTGDLVRFANAEDGGHLRAAAKISSHSLMGSDRTRFMQEAVKMDAKADFDGQFLRVSVNIANVGAGHHIPTGQPMRNMILLVSCADEAGRPLRFLVGERVPYWGGDLAGSAGKGYAKILTALSEYTKAALIVNDQTTVAEFPAPFWNRNKILSDNRIAAKASDQSLYVFQIPPQAKRLRVEARLIFRRAFKPLADAKGWDLPDITLAANEFEVDRAMKVMGALLLLTLTVPAQTQWQGQPFTVRAVAPGVYSFSAAFYSNLFIVTSEGVIATDPISPAVATMYAKAIKQVTAQPVRYVIYSHDHTDHIAGGKVFADTAQFIAHENTRADIAARGNPDIVLPQITFKTDYTLKLGGKEVRLLYFGENHSNGNIGIYLAAEKILMLVDMVYPGSVPFRDLPGTDIRKFLETLQRVRELDFKTLVYGHGPAGGKEWVDKYIDYFNDLIAAVKRSESEVTYYNVLLEQRESDPRKVLDAYIERIAARAVEAIRSKYGQWGGFDDWAPMNATRVVLFLMMDG